MISSGLLLGDEASLLSIFKKSEANIEGSFE
jgi:hypothetical protein